MNFYPFHIGDYASATRHLSWDEDAAYRRLLDVYYTTERALPLEMRQVFRLVMASTEAQREAVQTVLEEFFERTDEGWVNRRADAEIAVMRDKQDKQRAKANKRWQKPEEERGTASALPQHPNPDAAAQIADAAAMPPIPTPTPVPTPEEEPPSGVQGGKPPKPPAFVLPDWVPADPWTEFVEMRRAKGKRAPFTVAAAKGIVDDLAKLRDDGHDLACVLRQSVKSGWSGVFPIKGDARPASAGSMAQETFV